MTKQISTILIVAMILLGSLGCSTTKTNESVKSSTPEASALATPAEKNLKLTVDISHPTPTGELVSGGFGVDFNISYTGKAMAKLIHLEAYKEGIRTQEMLEFAGGIYGPEQSPGHTIENMKTSITIHDSKTSNFKLRDDPALGSDFFMITHMCEEGHTVNSGTKKISRNVYEPIGKSRGCGGFSEYDLTQDYIPIFYISSPASNIPLKNGRPVIPSNADCLIFYLQLQYK
jgi:hypothetical protein